MLHNDELLERIGHLERAIRFWKGLTFTLAAALFLFLALGTGIGVTLYFNAANREAEVEAMMRQAVQQEELARQRAVEALKAAEKAAEKKPW
jgi:hypothetical protein